MADDPGVLDLRADHEAGHVLEEDERDVEGVAEVDEARRLVGGVVVEDPGQLLGLVGDDPDRLAAEAGEAGDQRLGELRLDVEPLAVVDDLARSRRTCRRAGARSRGRSPSASPTCGRRDRRSRSPAASARSWRGSRRGSCLTARMHSSSSATSRSPTPDLRQWTLAPPSSSIEMSSPVTALVRCGPGQRHRALAGDHRHEVREGRDVGGAGRAGAHHRRDHRDHARHLDLLAEEVAGAGEERAGRLLDAGAGRVEQPDERHPLRRRHLAQAGRPSARRSSPSSRPSR